MKRARVTALILTVLAPGAVSGQGFGSVVATSGGQVLIGEPLNPYTPGLVHVFQRTGERWAAVGELRASDGKALDRFGRDLSIDVDRLLVGATSIDSSRGAAYVFERDRAGAWRQVAKLVAPGSASGDAYGRRVLLRGDVAYVASWGRNDARGAVTVWRRSSGGEWALEATVTAGDGAPNDHFGASLAVSGDILLVGAAERDTARGTAYVFRRDPATRQWNEEARLNGRGLARNARFGAAAAFFRDLVLVGAPGLDGGMGAVYVFGKDDDRWTEIRRLAAFDGTRGTQFGAALLTRPAELWVGAPGADERGTIYRVAVAPDSSLSGVTKLGAAGLDGGDGFGSALALAGDVAVVGTPGDDFGAGTAVILTRQGEGWSGGEKVWTEAKTLPAITGAKAICGSAGTIAAFGCQDVDLLAFLPIPAIGGARGVQLNDVWGWTDPTTRREYALVGRIDGTSFVDVTDPSNPRYLGNLPMTAGANAAPWRDIKVYHDHAFIVADGSGQHGVQVFDLTRLRHVAAPPETFTADAVYDRVASVHNIVIDTTSGFAFAVGAGGGGETCGGALHMIDIRTPKAPAFAGCFADPSTGLQRTGYTHDAQCVVYHGPDQAYRGRQICFNSSETAVGIADVTDKAAPKALSHAAYPNVGYTHQGWLTDDQRYFYVDDETDEITGKVDGTRTLIWDVSDLDDPVLAAEYISTNKASDHNLYVRGNLVYQSNYASGLRILDISDRLHPRPAGHFDTHPVGEDVPGYTGSWSNYPFFASGTIVVTSIEDGLFLLKKADRPLVP